MSRIETLTAALAGTLGEKRATIDTRAAGEAYAAVEHPENEIGICPISDNSNKSHRLKIRAPGSAHLSVFDEMARRHVIADAVAIIGTQDTVFGEVDR